MLAVRCEIELGLISLSISDIGTNCMSSKTESSMDDKFTKRLSVHLIATISRNFAQFRDEAMQLRRGEK
jgi:hypothetical protein